jgi:hypothetical protein
MLGHWIRFRRSSERALEALARQVAELSVEAISRLVIGQTGGMTPCEARGYVRARSAREIVRQTRLAISHLPGADASWESPVRQAATERVVPLVMRALRTTKAAAARAAEPDRINKAA